MINFFKEKQSSHVGNSKKFWSFYKSIVKTKKSKDSNLISCITDSNNFTNTTSDKIANIFNTHFSSLQPSSSLSFIDSSNYVDNFFKEKKRDGSLSVGSFSFKKFTEESVFEALMALDVGSACGFMQIPSAILKGSANALCPFLTNLYNMIVL